MNPTSEYQNGHFELHNTQYKICCTGMSEIKVQWMIIERERTVRRLRDSGMVKV